MNARRRIEELEAEAIRQGFDALTSRMQARLKHKTEAELAALAAALEHYCRTGEAAPGLVEIIQELTE